MANMVRMETLDGQLLHEGSDVRVVRSDSGAQLYFRLPDALAMDLAVSHRPCVIIARDKRRFSVTFNKLTTDGYSVLDLRTLDVS